MRGIYEFVIEASRKYGAVFILLEALFLIPYIYLPFRFEVW